MTIQLSLSSYHADITRPLMEGEVEPDGIDLTTISEYPPKRFRRFFEHGEYDVCEVSLSSYVASLSDPERYPFTAIPVFPERKFRHAFLYTLVDSDVEGPKDLEGGTVGVESWDTATGVWLRGILREHYDVAIDEVQWYRRKDDDVPIDVPDRFDVETLGADEVTDLSDHREAFFEGRFDAAIDPSGGVFNPVMESDDAELVFDDVYAEERRYYEETGIHPPMHTVAIRDEVLADHPWIAVNLYDAFCEARDRCLEWNRSPASHASLPWSHLHRHEYRSVLGDDVWEYGLTEKTRRELSTFARYAENQGLADRRYEPEELFADATVEL
jgi:4,5-dihydroxyphthalate decarboxylase